ncbi:MAG: hypothetical protein ACI4BB_10580 [Coprococcus sp.]
MKCHDAQLLIRGFIEKRLTDQQLEAFIDHIAGCQDCYDELEVYYMITTGLLQLDENHTGTLDLKKNLRNFIAEQREELYARKRAVSRNRHLSAAVFICILGTIMFLANVFLTSEEGIHSMEDLKRAVGNTVQKGWFIQEETTEPDEVLTDPIECRMNFELLHPLIPSYFSDLKLTEPEHRNILEKER